MGTFCDCPLPLPLAKSVEGRTHSECGICGRWIMAKFCYEPVGRSRAR